MKANIKQQIRILFILFVGCSFLFSTGCSGLRDWWGYDASTSQMRGNNYFFANNDLNQFYSSVRPVKGTVESDYRLAMYFQKRGKHKFAVDELLNAIRKDPSFIKAYNALGVSYDHLGNFDLAVKSYKFALQLNPELDYIHNNLGYSYLLNGNLDAAIDAFRKAIALKSTNKRYHNNLALAYVRKGQTDMAFEEFKLAENESDTRYKTTQTFKDPDHSLSPKETAIDTSPEGITPYDNIPENIETSHLLAVKDHGLSESNLEYALIPDTIDEMDLLEKYVQNEVKSSNLNLPHENKGKTESITPSVSQPIYIEISNGNGVRHMARNVGVYLNPKGFNANRLTNADHFNYPKTKIFYREGYEQDALRLAKEIPGRQEMPNLIEQNQMMRQAIKVLIGKDLVPFQEYIMGCIKSNSNIAKVENPSKKTS
jgi:tetratricopeptide (TPR) repeat protein